MGFGRQEGEFRLVVMALDGKLVDPFWVHESDWRQFTDEGRLEQFLIHQALAVGDPEIIDANMN